MIGAEATSQMPQGEVTGAEKKRLTLLLSMGAKALLLSRGSSTDSSFRGGQSLIGPVPCDLNPGYGWASSDTALQEVDLVADDRVE